MTIQNTSNLTNALRTQYVATYLLGLAQSRLYDQISVPYTKFSPGMSMDELMRHGSGGIQINFLSGMQPGVTALSEDHDVTPQILRDAYATITTTSRGEALEWSEQLDIKAYTNYAANRLKMLGENAAESIELLAIDAAVNGSWVVRAAARASLDAGTSGHRASDSIFREMQSRLMTLKVPGFVDENGNTNNWSAIMHPYLFHDIAESGNVNDIGLYQDAGIHLNFELGKIGPFRLVVSPWAKTFGAAGADNGTAVATTLASDANRLATTVVTSDDKSAAISAGEYWWIGSEETGSTLYSTNEPVKILSASGTTLTILGTGANGGLRYDHTAGEAVRNADSVYTIVFGGPASLVKLFATNVGEYGRVVGPKIIGILDQWQVVGWKFYGGYGRLTENRILRGEYSTSYEA